MRQGGRRTRRPPRSPPRGAGTDAEDVVAVSAHSLEPDFRKGTVRRLGAQDSHPCQGLTRSRPGFFSASGVRLTLRLARRDGHRRVLLAWYCLSHGTADGEMDSGHTPLSPCLRRIGARERRRPSASATQRATHASRGRAAHVWDAAARRSRQMTGCRRWGRGPRGHWPLPRTGGSDPYRRGEKRSSLSRPSPAAAGRRPDHRGSWGTSSGLRRAGVTEQHRATSPRGTGGGPGARPGPGRTAGPGPRTGPAPAAAGSPARHRTPGRVGPGRTATASCTVRVGKTPAVGRTTRRRALAAPPSPTLGRQ